MDTRTAIIGGIGAVLLLLLFIMPKKEAVAPGEIPVLPETSVILEEPVTPNDAEVIVPPGTTASDGTIVTAKIGQSISMAGATGTVLEVIEDSRCPANVQCIQAGTVRIKTRAVYGSLSQVITLTLDKPFTLNGRSVTLIGVQPLPIAGKTIAPSDYTFTFSLK